jgi:hypothetical protein
MKRITEASGAAREAKPLLRALAPGESVTISLPDSPDWRRQAYKHVGQAAYVLFGPGGYSLNGRSLPGKLIITRTIPTTLHRPTEEPMETTTTTQIS